MSLVDFMQQLQCLVMLCCCLCVSWCAFCCRRKLCEVVRQGSFV